jgi:hypothetical protein
VHDLRVTISIEGHPPPHGRFVANAIKGSDGWELDIEGEGLAGGGGITHAGNLDDAVEAVRSHLQTTYGVDFSDAIIEVVYAGGDSHLDSPGISG